MNLSPPSRHAILKEARAAKDVAHMVLRLMKKPGPAIETEPVMVLPGFGTSERAMRPLRHMLKRHAIHAEDWGLGRNLAGLNLPHTVDELESGWSLDPLQKYRGETGFVYLSDRLIERVKTRSEKLESKLSLIGWSLGGSLAREAARELPGHVKQVITLGSPVVGGPKYTLAGNQLAKSGLDIDWIEAQMQRREQWAIQVPITAIVSPSDGIVGYQAARDRTNPFVRHIEMNVSHIGMPLNPRVWDLILDILRTSH